MKTSGYYKFRRAAINTLVHLFLIGVAASCLMPLVWMVSSSLKTQETVFADMSLIPRQWHFENYSLAWREGGFGRYFLNSVFYTVSVVIGIIAVASLAAYAFSRLRFPGRRSLFLLFMAAMMIPLPGSFVALYALLNALHLRNTAAGYIVCMISVGLATSIFLLKTSFDKIPRELEDAARIDGASAFGIWWHVAMPLARPALAVVAVFSALNVWNEYVLAMIVFDTRSLMPLQRALMVFQGEFLTQYPLLMAGLTITTAPIVLAYLLMQRSIVRGVADTATFG